MTSQKSLNSSQTKKQKRSNLATTIVIPAISHHWIEFDQSILQSILSDLRRIFDVCNSECGSMLAALPPLQSSSETLSGSSQSSPDPIQTPRSSRALDAENARVIDAALRRFLKRHMVLGASEILRLLQPESAQMLRWPPHSHLPSPSKRARPSSESPAPLAVAQLAGPPIERPPPERTAGGGATSSNNDACSLSLVLCDRASLSPRGALSPLLPPLLQLSTLRQVPIVPVPQLELHLPRALRSTHCSFLGFKASLPESPFSEWVSSTLERVRESEAARAASASGAGGVGCRGAYFLSGPASSKEAREQRAREAADPLLFHTLNT